jgi:hypothetical protein
MRFIGIPTTHQGASDFWSEQWFFVRAGVTKYSGSEAELRFTAITNALPGPTFEALVTF